MCKDTQTRETDRDVEKSDKKRDGKIKRKGGGQTDKNRDEKDRAAGKVGKGGGGGGIEYGDR